MSFSPRTVFHNLDSLPRSYYLGHHAAGLAKMATLLSQIDLVIECRDYRIPLSSANPMFEETLKGRERLVVYTKKDLGTTGTHSLDNERHSLLQTLHAPAPVLFSNHQSHPDIRQILRYLRTFAAQPTGLSSLTGARLMVVGMPNVGKSSLLNALRRDGFGKAKSARTGAQPGITRKIGTSVKILAPPPDASPDGGAGGGGGSGGVYLLDTPGVFIPYVPDGEAMLKLALCGCVKDTIIQPFTLADYLLYHINLHAPELYEQYHPPTNEVMELLDAIARKTGRLRKGGQPDHEGTALWMIQKWRNGQLGRFLLDDVTEESLDRFRRGHVSKPSSVNQMRKAAKVAIRDKARTRRATAVAGV